MSAHQEVPILRGEELYIPFVGAIIEKEINQKKKILIQIRQKASDKSYSGLIEIPGGKMQAYEDVYETVAREVKEESGLEITFIDGRSKRIDHQNKQIRLRLLSLFV